MKYLSNVIYEQNLALNESNLITYLTIIFPNVKDWKHDKNLLGYRPDYYSEELKLIVEFDGPRHTEPKTIIRDKIKDDLY